MIGKWGFSLLPFYLGIIPIFANNNYTLTSHYCGNSSVTFSHGADQERKSCSHDFSNGLFHELSACQ